MVWVLIQFSCQGQANVTKCYKKVYMHESCQNSKGIGGDGGVISYAFNPEKISRKNYFTLREKIFLIIFVIKHDLKCII